MNCIAIFGACREGIEVYRSLYASSLIENKTIKFIFLDNDSRLKDSYYEGVPIYNPNDVNFSDIDLVVIGVIAFDRIKTQLESLNVSADKIKRYYSDIYFSDKIRKVGMATIGKYSYFKPSTILYNVEIGNYCHIGADCRLGLIGHDVNSLTTYPFDYQFGKSKDSLDCSKDKTIDLKKKNILKIGHDVYIGEGVTIMSGIEIGIGAVVGSKSVVTKDVPPYSVVAGIPAKVVTERLSIPVRNTLLESKWWEHDKDEAEEILKNLVFTTTL
jgi:virginiamycin A acetyltransferase